MEEYYDFLQYFGFGVMWDTLDLVEVGMGGD